MSVRQRAVARETLRQARIAAFRGDHREASLLFATIDRLYVVEVNPEMVVTRDGLS